MAVSRERGVDLIKTHDKSINKEKLLESLQDLRDKYFFDDLVLHMDNLSFHKSQDVKERMDELGFHYVYSVKYMPRYNGIEEVINIGKQSLKKMRLELILNGQQEELKSMIVDSFNKIDTQ